MTGVIPERFGESLAHQRAIVRRLRAANPGWSDDYALGYWHGMSDGANDNADGYHLSTGEMQAYTLAYRAAHKLYNGRLLASRRFTRWTEPAFGKDFWRCDRCNRVAGPYDDKPQHHRCVPKGGA